MEVEILLQHFAGSPSTSLDEIRARQSVVATVHSLPHLRADLVLLVQESRDVSRIVQRLMTMKGDAEDLITIKDAISIWTRIQERIAQEAEHMLPTSDDAGMDRDWKTLVALISRMKGMERLAERLAKAIDEEALRSLKAANPADPASDNDNFENSTRMDKNQPAFVIRPE